MSAAGTPFVLIPGFHDNTNGSVRGPNTIMRWTQAGLRFAHFGDYGQDELTAAQLADLRDLDVMMFPAGGFFTPDGSQMAKLIDQLKPRVAILMHFRTAVGGAAQTAGHPGVVSPFPQIRYKPASLTLSRATLPATDEVWVMEPAGDAVAVPAAGFTAGAPASPGGIVSVFGRFTNEIGSFFQSLNLPLPRRLGDIEVFVGAEAVPLYYASANQINFQVPARQAPGQEILEVRVAGQRVARGTLTMVPRSPGLFVATDQAGRLDRVRRGEVLTIYGTGQGAVTPAVADGAAPPVNPPSQTGDLPTVLIGGRPAQVTFSGLAPGYPGVWQINARIASDAPVGTVDLVVLYESNLPSNALKIAVE